MMTKTKDSKPSDTSSKAKPGDLIVEPKRRGVCETGVSTSEENHKRNTKKKPMTCVGGWSGLFRGTPDF